MTELKKIIYAEDEPDLQTVVEMTVQAMSDFEMKICDNGKILLECVEEYSPDLIMLDVMMPELDGPSTFNKLKEMEKLKNVPVIFMTAKAQVHEVEHFKSLGAIGVITKPFDPMTLCEEIQNIWNASYK